MRVFRFWRTVQANVLIDGELREISCLGGSNHSEHDALADGQRRIEAVRRRIAGLREDGDHDYEGDIREEPIRWMGDRDVVTRNRYGAEVLNTTSCVFIDIDEPTFHLWRIFAPLRTRAQRKQAILESVAKRFRKPDLKGVGVRVYETHSGVRLLLDGTVLDPRSKEARGLMSSLNADPLYARLCGKQNCYRARLTPKPHRIKMKAIRLQYPYAEEGRDRAEAWIAEYDARSRQFSTCRLVEVLGSESGSSAVRYHDDRTKARSTLPLA